MAKLDLTGQRFGRLVVLGEDPIRAKGWKVRWRCRCDCGMERSILTNSLTRGQTRSCGCYMRERSAEANLIHGQSDGGGRRKPSRLYVIWSSMRGRCNRPTNQDYARYGGRGIKICDEWADFPAFELWALGNGYSDNLSIDRIDNDGGYSPDNCRWEDAKGQARNRASSAVFAYGGLTASLAQHAENAGLSPKTVHNRINACGWSVERALETPARYRPPR